MNTWLTDIVRHANERLIADGDLNRIMVYYATVPARLKLSEELERAEPNLLRPLTDELRRRFPERTLYTKPFLLDMIEGLRHVNLAVLADDLKLVRLRWTDHLVRALAALDVDPLEVRDAYAVLREHLEKRLSGAAWEVFQPAFDDLLDALTAAQPVAA